MRLNRIQQYLSGRGWQFHYWEQDGLGSIDFEYRGIEYHIWEFYQEPLDREKKRTETADAVIYGAESNLKSGGRMDEYFGDYEAELIKEIENWRQRNERVGRMS